jgi:hypothetical protein
MKVLRTAAFTAALMTVAVASLTGPAQAQVQTQGWGWGGAGPAGWGYDYEFIYACSPTWNYTTGWSYPPCITRFTPTWNYTTGWSYPGLGGYPGYGPARGGY